MRVNEINEMAISDTSDFEQDERSFQPLIYLEYVLFNLMDQNCSQIKKLNVAPLHL